MFLVFLPKGTSSLKEGESVYELRSCGYTHVSDRILDIVVIKDWVSLIKACFSQNSKTNKNSGRIRDTKLALIILTPSAAYKTNRTVSVEVLKISL